MVPGFSPARSFSALLRTLTVVLVSIATPLSLAVAPDDSPASRKLDHVRHTRTGPQRLDVTDNAGHHEVGAGPDAVDFTSMSEVVADEVRRSGPPGQLAIIVAPASLEDAAQQLTPRLHTPVSPPLPGDHRQPPGRAPPAI